MRWDLMSMWIRKQQLKRDGYSALDTLPTDDNGDVIGTWEVVHIPTGDSAQATAITPDPFSWSDDAPSVLYVWGEIYSLNDDGEFQYKSNFTDYWDIADCVFLEIEAAQDVA